MPTQHPRLGTVSIFAERLRKSTGRRSKKSDYAPWLKLGASRAMPAISGIEVLRRSPRRSISNADAWSRVVFSPQTVQWCFLSHNFLGTGAPHGHGCEDPRASTFTSSLSALSAL